MLLCGAVAVSCLVGFTGCKKEDGEIPIVSVATAEEYYAAEGKHINLTQDIVLDTSHAYFKESERDLSGLVLNGNGHTITIKGEEGSVGKTTGGLFTDIQDSTVKNLKIVYDILKVVSSHLKIRECVKACTGGGEKHRVAIFCRISCSIYRIVKITFFNDLKSAVGK